MKDFKNVTGFWIAVWFAAGIAIALVYKLFGVENPLATTAFLFSVVALAKLSSNRKE